MKRAVYTFTLLLFVRMTKMTKMATMVKMNTSNQEEHQGMTTSSLEHQRVTAPKQEHQRIVTSSTGSESEQQHPKPIISVAGSPSFINSILFFLIKDKNMKGNIVNQEIELTVDSKIQVLFMHEEICLQ